MPITLAPSIADYITADNTGDARRFGQCFVEDAIVRDEGHTYRGRAAIEQWNTEARAKYQHRIEPVSAKEADGRTIVTMRLAGQFPGSPIDVDFAFQLADDKIIGLEIGL
ncbi:nuclear transport factor 2 family protein [Rhodopseudomonas sp. P2A-2r]|uniref:nuclear transport factor 2 family protein n=1 Tax=unclassified Rhodopseudomonas TaxID=2638247 RepID=UPI0022341D12|nr:nuclear transport factor 2 family protein [Rhodopseudomonas sp. P2A-2r]UZE52031.1 nuclear transport factor 2 family protein [Rhodopseudomonas sp. P2A-2r]